MLSHSVMHGQPTPYGPAGTQLPPLLSLMTQHLTAPLIPIGHTLLTQPLCSSSNLLTSPISAQCRQTSQFGTSQAASVDQPPTHSPPEQTAQRRNKPPPRPPQCIYSAPLNSLTHRHMACSQTTWLPGQGLRYSATLSLLPFWGQLGGHCLRQGSQPSRGAVRPSEQLDWKNSSARCPDRVAVRARALTTHFPGLPGLAQFIWNPIKD